MLGRFEKAKAFVLMISPGFDDEKACRVAFFGPLRKLIGSFHLQSICWQLQLERQTKKEQLFQIHFAYNDRYLKVHSG